MSKDKIKIIEKFYQAFSKLDSETMVSCYHDDIEFQDPAFGKLKGKQAKDMWRMLCNSQTQNSFEVRFKDIKVEGQRASAFWEAKYLFSKTGRKVHNKINAQFEFEGGKIIKHHDDFNVYSWSKQAIGPMGYLIGWTGFFRKKLQKQTHSLLAKFQKT